MGSAGARCVAVLLGLLVVTAGCGDRSDSSSTTAPTTVTTTTETFSGSFVQLGSASHAFAVSASGPVTVTLTSVSPLATMGLGVGISTWDGTSCVTAIAQNADARAGTAALSGTATAGNYCVRVYDSGNVPADWTIDYVVDVVHP